MDNLFQTSLFAGVTVSLVAYLLGMLLKKKFKLAILNPLLISIVLTIIVLVVADVDYDTYNKGASYLSWFLTPATYALRYHSMSSGILLKKNISSSRARTHGRSHNKPCDVLVLSVLWGFHTRTMSHCFQSPSRQLSVWALSEELGGYVTITVAVIVVTGVIGNISRRVCFAKIISEITEPYYRRTARLGASLTCT